MGFVHSEWIIKGNLASSAQANVFAEGNTFDDKLYTFKEADYK